MQPRTLHLILWREDPRVIRRRETERGQDEVKRTSPGFGFWILPVYSLMLPWRCFQGSLLFFTNTWMDFCLVGDVFYGYDLMGFVMNFE